MTGGGRNGDNDDDLTEAHLLEESTDGTSDGIIKKWADALVPMEIILTNSKLGAYLFLAERRA